MSERAFVLRDEYRPDYEPAEGQAPQQGVFDDSTYANPATGETVSTAALLEEGGGVIRTADEHLAAHLSASPLFKTTTLAAAQEAGAEAPVELDLVDADAHSKDQLLAIAGDEVGPDSGLTDRDSKSTIAEAINQQRRSGAGEE